MHAAPGFGARSPSLVQGELDSNAISAELPLMTMLDRLQHLEATVVEEANAARSWMRIHTWLGLPARVALHAGACPSAVRLMAWRRLRVTSSKVGTRWARLSGRLTECNPGSFGGLLPSLLAGLQGSMAEVWVSANASIPVTQQGSALHERRAAAWRHSGRLHRTASSGFHAKGRDARASHL